jgi:hypothetical protein
MFLFFTQIQYFADSCGGSGKEMVLKLPDLKPTEFQASHPNKLFHGIHD